MKKLNLNKIKHVFAGGGAILTNQKHVLITILIFIELLLITCAYISYGNKNLDKYIFGKSETAKSSSFAFMLENDNGNYILSKDNTFPGDLYTYNQEKSGCMDADGEMIENSLLFDSTKQQITITITKTTKCYLYFDRLKEEPTFSEELIKTGDLWDSKLDGDGYRYIGSGTVGTSTNPNNFVCFGTTDKDTCTANPSTYMYRIIGIFKLNDNSYYAKLIKYKQLSSTYTWHSSRTTDTAWGSSAMYTGLNGSYFLTNTTYSYMQDTTWTNRIADWTWTTVNTLTSSSSGPNYYNGLSPSNIYLHEMNKDSKTSTVGTWTTTSAKIGLMYASDFALSLGDSALALTTGTYANRTTLLTGWIHQNKNGYSNNEWLIDRYGKSGSYYYAYYLNSAGYVTNSYAYNSYYVRPVFYLKNDTRKTSGTGSSTDPYILDVTDKLYVNLSNSGSTLTATITKGTGNLNKYCINTSSSITNCTWNNITNTSITYKMPSGGTYYVHVIDDAGYIAHSSLTYVAWNSNLTLAENLITYRDLWQSGLEGDGYRVTGTGVTCSYDNGNFFAPADNQSTTPTCPTLYNYTRTKISDSTTTNYTYKTSCPSNTSTYTYSCTKLTAESMDSSNVPKNFICFGTTDKDTCTSNPSTYMYRIIGVFADENGDNHVKLIKYTQLSTAYAWNSTNADVDWADSDLYKGLNGSYYLINTAYSYMQDNTWLNKITDWKWTAVNTKAYDGSSGPDYYYSLSPSNIYLHEMNRSTKTSTIGEWTTPTAKIGLMYASDYALSLGQTALSMTTSSVSNAYTLKTGWMHQSNNNTKASTTEWTISRVGADDSRFDAWHVKSAGDIGDYYVTYDDVGVRPVLYLESDISGSGEGTLENPIMIN